jgi:hypothetical protein
MLYVLLFIKLATGMPLDADGDILVFESRAECQRTAGYFFEHSPRAHEVLRSECILAKAG